MHRRRDRHRGGTRYLHDLAAIRASATPAARAVVNLESLAAVFARENDHIRTFVMVA